MQKEVLMQKQLELCAQNQWDFSDLKALFINCTQKKTPELSPTEGLIRISQAIMEKVGVSVEVLRAVDYDIAYGVYPDMTEHGWEKDEWPDIYAKVMEANTSIPVRAVPRMTSPIETPLL